MLVGRHRFGRVEILPAQRRVLVDGQPRALGARAFDMLLVLVEHRDRIVSKDELLDRVWAGMVVEENNLPVQVSTLRKLLGPQAIATVPGRGYRFTLVDGEEEAAAHAAGPAQTPPAPLQSPPPSAPAPSAPVPSAPATAAKAPPAGAAGVAAAADAPADGLLAPAAPRFDLPSDAEPIIGREEEVYDIVGLLAEHRLVSIVGAGGMGKTRLARAVMKRLREDFVDGVWWVDLAALEAPRVDDPDGVDALLLQRLAAAIGLRAHGDGHITPRADAATLTAILAATLVHELAARSRALVVLDNGEHVAAALARVLAVWLEALPALRLLVTSRTPLHLAAEQVWRLDALAVPAAGATLAQARRCGAFELFEARARASDRRFVLDDAALPAAIELCQRLEGHALSIEMAAARAAQLGLAGLLARLDERLRMLRSRDPLQPARQQTLRATLDWSCSLLGETERQVLWRLAVFAGWFELDEAQVVAADDGAIDAWAVLDALAVLVDHSLVQIALPAAASAEPVSAVIADASIDDTVAPEAATVTPAADLRVPRYRLAETTRLYGLEQLAAGADAAPTRARLARVRGDPAA